MGYYTDYYLKIDGEHDKEKVLKELKIISNVSVSENNLNYLFDGITINSKWYDSSENFKELSKLFPDLIFSLYGVGEENGDVWVEYFKNGKNDYQKAILPDYNESRLK